MKLSPNEYEIRLLELKKAILSSREDLLAFAKYMRPDMRDPGDATRSTYTVARHHEFMAEKLMELERGTIKRLALSLPPRMGKSELAQKTFVPWVMGRNPRWHIVTATYNSNFSEDFGRAVRGMLKEPRFQNVFPDVVLKEGAQSVSRLETEAGALAHFVGRGGALTGRGGHLMVVDDPIKDRAEADSPTIRDALWKWFTQVFSTRLMDDDGRMLIIQTRWHEDDLIGRLTDPNNVHYNRLEAAGWEVVNLPALAQPGDPLGRKENEPLWPQRFSTTYLARIRNQDPRGFSALYQGEPAPQSGLFFSPDDIVEYQHIREFPKGATMYAASDHAVSTTQWADKSAFIVFGVDENDDIWIHPDSILERIPSEEAVERMLHLMRLHAPMFWWAESGHISKSIGPFLRKRMLEERVYCSLIEMTPTKDKQTRAQSIKGRMSMKKVRFPSWAPWYAEARNQIMTFPAGSKDDFVDALSMVGLGLSMQFNVSRGTPKKAPTPGTFAALLDHSNRKRRQSKIIDMTKGW